MATKRWKLVVTDLGGGEPLSEVTTEGDNWMQALGAARAELGEAGTVPPGASCVPSADGGVTVLDPQQRRRYELTALGEAAAAPAAPEAPSAAGENVAAEPEQSPQAKKKRLKQTVAYMPSPVAEQPPEPSQGKKLSKQTVAFTSPFAQGAPSKEVVVGQGPAGTAPAAPSTAGPSGATEGDASARAEATTGAETAEPAAPPTDAPEKETEKAAGDDVELLLERDEEPSDDNPLRYRERIYVVPPQTSRGEAERIVRERFEALRRSLADAPQGKFFNMAVFDHRWEGQPERPPLVTLEWKDWRGEPRVATPSARPPAASKPSGPPPAAAEQDTRLAHAFEACQDLLFLSSAGEGVGFVMRLLGELVPSEAAHGCLYDINADEQRVVVATGPGAEGVKGRGLPAKAGLMAVANDLLGKALRVDDLPADGRFQPDSEGHPGLEAQNALYAPLDHQGQLVGMIQLFNRMHEPAFTPSDAEVVSYVAGQLAEFIHGTRAGG